VRQAEDIDTMGAGPAPSMSAMTKDQFRHSVAGATVGAIALGGLAAVVAIVARALGGVGWAVFGAMIVAGCVAGATAGAVIGGRAGGEHQIAEEENAHVSALRLVVHAHNDDEARRAKEMLQRRRPESLSDLRRSG
jgi:hypothetical protein